METKTPSAWPALPDLGQRVYYLPEWPYPVNGGPVLMGRAFLRLFRSSDGGHVAVVEDTPSGPGLSVTNGAEHIWRSLCDDVAGGGPITQVELYRCGRDGGPGLHFDQYIGDPLWRGHRWRPLSDISPLHPDHDAVTAWTAKWAKIITEA